MSQLDQKNTLLRRWHGPLTTDLVQQPSVFGLGRLPARLEPDAVTDMVCGYCSTGCSLSVHMANKVAVNLTPSRAATVNQGMACPKGWEALSALSAEDRATMPMMRRKRKNLEPVNWDAALKAFSKNFKRILAQHGPESVAFLSTGQIPTEEMALLGAVAKFGMGLRHGDGNTRQCMASAAVAYKQSFGFDAPPYTYKDFEVSDTLVFIGANPCIAHPIMWQRVLRNPDDPKIIVIDPRRTETAEAATHHCQLKSKSDIWLLYGIAKLIIDNGWVDQEFLSTHTRDFEPFKLFLEDINIDQVLSQTGVSMPQLAGLAKDIGTGKAVSFWWTMGINQGHQAVRTAQAIINLALMTGNIGRPGTGANSLTGQTNAMGSRLFSNTTNLLGGRDFANPQHRQQVAECLDIDQSRIPDSGSLAYPEIIDRIKTGHVKGLWVIATNPAHSWIDRDTFTEEVLNKLDYLVVQDMYSTTETARQADLLLPAAGWGEKEGTVINSERRLGLYKNVSHAPGQALADFYIFKLIADYWGCSDLFREWECPEAVFGILKRLSAGQPCDISGIAGYEMIDAEGGIQWPMVDGQLLDDQERRLFEDGQFYTSDKKAVFYYEDPVLPPERPSAGYPMALLTGRGTSAQFHTQTRTSKSAVLKKLYPQNAYVEIHPDDAKTYGIEPNSVVEVESPRAVVRAVAHVQNTVRKGEVFMPMHYEETNQLTNAVFDPLSRQPSYKYCAVRVSSLT